MPQQQKNTIQALLKKPLWIIRKKFHLIWGGIFPYAQSIEHTMYYNKDKNIWWL